MGNLPMERSYSNAVRPQVEVNHSRQRKFVELVSLARLLNRSDDRCSSSTTSHGRVAHATKRRPMPDSPSSRRRMMVHGLTPARKAPTAPGGAPATNPNRPTAPILIGHGYDIHRLEKG